MLRKIFIGRDGGTRAGWLFLLGAIAWIAAQFLAGTFAFLFGKPESLRFEAVFRPLALAISIALFCVMIKLLNKSAEPPLDSQGLGTKGPWLRELLVGSVLGTGMIALAVVAIKVLGDYSFQPVFNVSSLTRMMFILWITATAAAVEEVGFRGYPFQRLVSAIGPWGATAALSGLFGIIHLYNPHASPVGFANTVLVGVLLSLAYLRTKLLWMPIGIHFAWNLVLGLVFGLPVSGTNLFSVMGKGTASGPVLLTGGDYGIEASITGTAVILVGLLALFALTRNSFVSNDAKPLESASN